MALHERGLEVQGGWVLRLLFHREQGLEDLEFGGRFADETRPPRPIAKKFVNAVLPAKNNKSACEVARTGPVSVTH